jgi:hypothetical protein
MADRYRRRGTSRCRLWAGVTLPADHQPRGVVCGRRFAISHALCAGSGGVADLGSTLGSRNRRRWGDCGHVRPPAPVVSRFRRQPDRRCRRSGDVGEHLRRGGRRPPACPVGAGAGRRRGSPRAHPGSGEPPFRGRALEGAKWAKDHPAPRFDPVAADGIAAWSEVSEAEAAP